MMRAFGNRVGLLIASACMVLSAGVTARGADPSRERAPEPTPEQAKFFESKVRPLLVEQCLSCHGEKKQKGKLRLDSIEAALKGGENGPALVPGDPAKSRMIVGISYKDADFQMPPEEKLADSQVQVLTDWIAMGAPWPKNAAVASPAVNSKKRIIKPEDRQFWSFQPVKDVASPAVSDAAHWVRNPVDAFVLQKLQAEGLTPAPEADKATLIRRVTFDLIGIPPTPAEVEAFVADKAADAYEKLVDRLLASPHYGEHFARHWLDVVRYAESDGFKADGFRPNAYPYRDWVIQSFNADKPYDRFVKEQIAGDELYPDDPDARVATGYLRHGMYEYNQKNAEGQWSDYVNDITDVTADAFIGLSLGCARCHDHKFDPILQTDYFRLQAFFSPVLPRNDLLHGTREQLTAYQARLAKWEADTKKIRAEIAELEQPTRDSIEKGMVSRFPPVVQAMMNKSPADRSPYERQIAYLVMRQVEDDLKKLDDKIKGAKKDRLVELRKELSKFDDEKPHAPPTALCATDIGPVAPPTHIPGDPEKRDLLPGYPVVLDELRLPTPVIQPLSASTGRRTALAAWLTEPSNPLTTRVITNRIWQWHFGKGLVRTSSDYGRLGEPPSHPELLDWLTHRFVSQGWSMKQLHKLILTSATYRQSSLRPMPEIAKLKDPENRWLWRMNTRRLDAEQIRDAILAVSGELQLDVSSGPSVDYTAPKRTIYTKVVRNTRDPLLDVFDAPEAFGSVASRNTTTTATQSLLMVNGDWPLKRAAAFAQRVSREAPSADADSIAEQAYRIAYGKPARAEERKALVEYLKRPAKAVAEVAVAPVGDVNDQPVTQLMPQVGGQAVLVRNASPADMLKMPPAPAALFKDQFTIEAYVLLESIYDNANVRVIASQWNGDQKSPGWSLGVTSEKSAYQSRNLILQLAGDSTDASKKGGYEVIASNLRLEMHRVYYVGVAVDLADTSEKGITFWVKDVGDMDAPLRSAKVRHTVTGSVATGPSPLIIGGREAGNGQAGHGWDGLIGELRISKAVLKPEQILWADGDPKEAIVGYWRFEETPGSLKESAARMPDLVRLAQGPKPTKTAVPTKVAPASKIDPALVDLCHVLLNSNGFLYVD